MLQGHSVLSSLTEHERSRMAHNAAAAFTGTAGTVHDLEDIYETEQEVVREHETAFSLAYDPTAFSAGRGGLAFVTGPYPGPDLKVQAWRQHVRISSTQAASDTVPFGSLRLCQSSPVVFLVLGLS